MKPGVITSFHYCDIPPQLKNCFKCHKIVTTLHHNPGAQEAARTREGGGVQDSKPHNGVTVSLVAHATHSPHNICLTSLTRAKCGVPSTLCWKIGKISTSTELFGFNFADNNLKLPNLSIHAFVIIQKSLEVH